MSDPAVYLPAMARIGAPGPVLRALYEMLQRGDRMDDLDYTFGPLVVHGDPKSLDDILPRFTPFVYEERLQILFGHLPDHVVSPTEIMLVMHNAVLWGGGPPLGRCCGC